MLKKFLKYQLSLSDEGRPFHRLRPLFTAIDTFLYEAPLSTKSRPHIRDAIDLKRIMMLVVISLIPCTLVGIWNSGLQKMIYASSDLALFQEYSAASHSFATYFEFAFKDGRTWTILKGGLGIFLPIVIITYVVGGFWEILFAVIRRHEISEGFLVTGILYALILPSTIPYWMVAVGISLGVVLGKEIFGGTGMNILNPALLARCILFFTFPTKMSGEVWVGSNPTVIQYSVQTMDRSGNGDLFDSVTQASALNRLNISTEIKRIHVAAIAAYLQKPDTFANHIEKRLKMWNPNVTLNSLTPDALEEFMTAPYDEGGLNLSPENYRDAVAFANLKYGQGTLSNGNLFLGNMIGSIGETSTLAAIIGALFLLMTGIASWRTMLAIILGAIATASLFQFGAEYWGPLNGAWNPAKFDFPAYKHLLIGSLAFGLVFMATEPVTSPNRKGAKWIYGLMIGALVIIIRLVNPAFPEGVMLAILFGNVFAPLLDHEALQFYIRRRRARARKILQ